MASLQVVPLIVGELKLPRSRLLDQRGPDTPISAPSILWLVEADGQRIVVDTGPGDVDRAHARGRTHYRRSASQHPTSRLGDLGVDADTVDVVVLTHLHWDHCGDLDLYTSAFITVQYDDVVFAAHPAPKQRSAFDWNVVSMLRQHNVEVIAGDLTLSPNLKVLHTPGHTPGSQSVAVGGLDGFVIAGDTVPLAASLHPRPVPNGIRSDRAALVRSQERLAAFGRTVLPSHDPILTQFDGIDLMTCKEQLCNALR